MHTYYIYILLIMWINHTNVELKCLSSIAYIILIMWINHTNVELKFIIKLS